MASPILTSKPAGTSPGFDALCAFLNRASGLTLDRDKQYLIESKVMPIVTRERLSGLSELAALLDRGCAPHIENEVVQAMTVNETYFFRDRLPFDAFRTIMLPRMVKARAREKTLRIWSAACSAGQEPYSLAMLLEDAGYLLGSWKIELLATDLSETALEKARSGRYTAFDIRRGLPERLLQMHFSQIGTHWEISARIRDRVTFHKVNLIDDFRLFGCFDIIFCRNVLIYFDPSRKKEVLTRLMQSLAPDGFLVLGTSESVFGCGTNLVHDTANQFFEQRS